MYNDEFFYLRITINEEESNKRGKQKEMENLQFDVAFRNLTIDYIRYPTSKKQRMVIYILSYILDHLTLSEIYKSIQINDSY